MNTTKEQKITGSVSIDASTREALDLMNELGVDALPVTTLDGTRSAGMVLRPEIERGCLYVGHESGCAVRNHLKTGVATVTRSELEEARESVAGAGEPVVVVDENGRPVYAILPHDG